MATKVPVFINVPINATVTPSSSPVLVDIGGALDVVYHVSLPNLIISEILVNGLVVATNVRKYTVHLTNIQNPTFVNAHPVIGSTISPYIAHDPCCGIHTMQLGLQEDGSVTGTLAGLKPDVLDMAAIMMGGAVGMPKLGSGAFRVTSWREEGAIFTITVTSLVNSTYEKIPSSAVFKTVPQDIYDLHMSGIIPRSMQNPLDAPDSNIYIKNSDIYGTDGWTVQDILDTLGIRAKVPASFNYHVYQLTVTRGAPVISLMHNLLPIPGLVIERVASSQGNNIIASYYISIAQGSAFFSGTVCHTLGSSSRTLVYDTTVIGLPGEPQYITATATQIGTNANSMTLNLIGGVFSVDTSTSVNTTESASQNSVYFTI